MIEAATSGTIGPAIGRGAGWPGTALMSGVAGSLGSAIELTAGSELMLRTLGEHMLDRFVALKRREWEQYRVHVTAWERDRYLPVL